MREYLFRGKRKDNGEWAIGNLVSTSPDEAFILLGVTGHIKRDDYECYMVEVIPETVGQFIDRKDNDGKKIFEGDILLSHDQNGNELFTIAVWVPCGARYEGSPITGNGIWINKGAYRNPDLFSLFKIIGNTTDNPELLNPTGGQSGISDMKDPNVKTEQEAGEANSEAAQESASQDQAMGASEEVTEG